MSVGSEHINWDGHMDSRILTYLLTHSLTPWCRILF